MKVLGVIPARWASTRFPGKVLADIGGKSVIQHVWERASQAQLLTRIVIACDEPHVFKFVQSFGAEALMTRKDHISGSDRVAEVAAQSDEDIVVNIQGDEPFIDPHVIDALIKALAQDECSDMATVIKRISNEDDLRNANIVKVVINTFSDALYFSRSPIPFRRDGVRNNYSLYFRHIGIYAYRRDFLFTFCKWPRSFLEQEESLEQLRALENGARIKTVETKSDVFGVDTPEDLVKANAYFQHIHAQGLE